MENLTYHTLALSEYVFCTVHGGETVNSNWVANCGKLEHHTVVLFNVESGTVGFSVAHMPDHIYRIKEL